MSVHACPVVAVSVEPHPDADRLEIARVGGFELVVAKGQWSSGDRAVYIPEQSIVPEGLIDELGLTGRLAGSKANRVKAIRLRGVLSQGLLVPLDSPHLADVSEFALGDDLAKELGISKWHPPTPAYTNGPVVEATFVRGFSDIESWQSQPGRFADGEPVHITEKLHGTFCALTFDPEHGPCVSSKGLLGKFSFDLADSANEGNVYVEAWKRHGDAIGACARALGWPVTVMGEVVGPKIQDLTYGLAERELRVFDVRRGDEWADAADVEQQAEELGIPHVPVVQRAAAFDHESVLRLASDPSLLGGGLREGVVVRPCEPRRDLHGRLVAKYVNPAYLTRKGGTEYN